MENKSKIGILSVLIALIAMLLLITSIAIVESTYSQEAKVENLIDPLSSLGSGNSGFSGSNIQIFDSSDSSNSDDDSDDEAPNSITGLTAGDVGSDYIYWTWTNPTNTDFYRNRVYLNGVYQTSTSDNFYNATGLASDTNYTITIHTMDDSSNVNNTDVSDTQTTLPGGSGPNSPVITPIIPDVSFDEDTIDTTLVLDTYVTDPDDAINTLTWTATGNTNIIVNIDPLDSNRVTFSAPADWNGAELITFRVEDPATNWDNQVVTVTINPIDDAAVWNPLSDQSIPENSPADTVVYSNIVSECSDIDSPVTPLSFSVPFNTNFILRVEGNDLVVTSLTTDWSGVETVTVNCNGVPATFDLTVTGINSAPTITASLADQTMNEDTNINDAFDLTSYFNDVEDGSAGLIYSVVLQTNAGIVNAVVDAGNMLDINTVANQYGASTVTVRATDSGGLFVEQTFTITVTQLFDDEINQCGPYGCIVTYA